MNFDGGPDYLEESFSYAINEEADMMFQGKIPLFRRLGYIPFVCWSEGENVLAVERAEDSIS